MDNQIFEYNKILGHCVENQMFIQEEKLVSQQRELEDFYEMIKNYKK